METWHWFNKISTISTFNSIITKIVLLFYSWIHIPYKGWTIISDLYVKFLSSFWITKMRNSHIVRGTDGTILTIAQKVFCVSIFYASRQRNVVGFYSLGGTFHQRLDSENFLNKNSGFMYNIIQNWANSSFIIKDKRNIFLLSNSIIWSCFEV